MRAAALAATGKSAEIVEYPDGRIIVRHSGAELSYRVIDKNRRGDQAAVVENRISPNEAVDLLASRINGSLKRPGTGRPSDPARSDGYAPARARTARSVTFLTCRSG